MPSPSESLQEHFSLELSPDWIDWFDHSLNSVRPPGAMREVVAADHLVASTPSQIWPGFMLPDTLPIIGNSYGDWLCARIDENNGFGELIYWYHGGGDWIPVGKNLSEALLHDAIDHFRPIRKQAVRGATELEKTGDAALLSRLGEPQFQNWLEQSLPQLPHKNALTFLNALPGQLEDGGYSDAITRMYEFRWAFEAIACDLIEDALQTPLTQIANAAFAEKHGYSWYPEYVAWMFDLGTIPEEVIDDLRNSSAAAWPTQKWEKASAIANQVLQSRNDLGWAFTISGWQHEREGNAEKAASTYFAGRFASSFADQSVRLSCHSLSERMGKFSVERLALLLDKGQVPKSDDAYLHLFLDDSKQSVLARLHQYWWDQGSEHMENGNFSTAYYCFMKSGWDMGVSRLSDYSIILNALSDAALKAGWPARAAVARKHLECLDR